MEHATFIELRLEPSRSTSFFEAHARRMDGGGLSPPLLRAESLAESLAERIAILKP